MMRIRSYDEPKNATELAKILELFLLDGLGKSCNGGIGVAGGEFSVWLDDDEVSILVLPTDQTPESIGRIIDGFKSVFLDADEQRLIEAHRVVRKADAEREQRQKFERLKAAITP